MTMRLDIVSNDAGESVRRERARELGAEVVVELYKMVKLVTVHDLGNEAVVRQRDQTYQAVQEYCLKSGLPVAILFAHKAVFVGGQLLRGSRSVYDAALELGQAVERLGGSELTVTRDLTREDLHKLVEAFAQTFRNGRPFSSPTPRFRVRPVNPAARLRGLELEVLTADERIVRTYASAVVILRRFYEDLARSRYVMPRRIKRVAQGLVDLSLGNTPAFLGVTEVRNANEDEAGRAVNATILAVAMARELTDDRGILAQIAVAAMMYGVGRPRALALGAGDDRLIEALTDGEEDRLAAGSAAVLTALGRVNEPTITRTVIAFEAQWLRRGESLGDLYGGIRKPTVQARLVHIARMYNDAMLPELGLVPKHPDRALAELLRASATEADRSLLRVLAAALGLLPVGTVLQLASGEVAEVVPNASPAARVRIRIVMDRNGAVAAGPEVELACDAGRTATKVVSIDGWSRNLAVEDAYAGYLSEPPASEHLASQLDALAALPSASYSIRPSVPSFADRSASAVSTGGLSRPAEQVRTFAVSASAQLAEERTGDDLAPDSAGTSPSQVGQAMGLDLLMAQSGRAPRGRALGVEVNVPTTGPAVDRRDTYQGQLEPSSARRQSMSSSLAYLAPSVPPPPQIELEPTARGVLATTPVAHLLVYILEHGLSGTVTFHTEAGAIHNVYFDNGVPAQARLGIPSLPLGELLADHGHIDRGLITEYVQAAQNFGLLLGEYLVGETTITRVALETALAFQLAHRVTLLANLPVSTTYAFYSAINMADGNTQGAELVSLSPLRLILDVVRAWEDTSRITATLTRIRAVPLHLHPEANVEALLLDGDEAQLVTSILRAPQSPDTLVADALLPEAVCKSVLYALAVTRQFALPGQANPPMYARAAPLSVDAALEVLGRSIALPQVTAGGDGTPKAQQSAAATAPSVVAPAAVAAVAPVSGERTSAVPNQVSANQPTSPKRPLIRPRGDSPLRITNTTAAPASTRIDAATPASTRSIQIASKSMHPSAAPGAGSSLAPASTSSRPGEPLAAVNQAQARPQDAGNLPPARGRTPSIVRALPPKTVPTEPLRVPNRDPAQASAASTSKLSAHATDVETPDDVAVDWSALDDDEAERSMEAMTNHRRAEALVAKGQLEQALTYSSKAVASAPEQGDYRALEVWLSLSLRRITTEAAIDAWTAVVDSEASCHAARLFRARVYVERGAPEAARADFEAILAEDANHAEARRELRKFRK
jgi:hypothetical protein